MLGPADDGGWWVLGLRNPTAAVALHDVPMSTPTTYDDTRQALESAGLRVGVTGSLRDVDTVRGRRLQWPASVPDGEFARAWAPAGDASMSEESFSTVFSHALRGLPCSVHGPRRACRSRCRWTSGPAPPTPTTGPCSRTASARPSTSAAARAG